MSSDLDERGLEAALLVAALLDEQHPPKRRRASTHRGGHAIPPALRGGGAVGRGNVVSRSVKEVRIMGKGKGKPKKGKKGGKYRRRTACR